MKYMKNIRNFLYVVLNICVDHFMDNNCFVDVYFVNIHCFFFFLFVATVNFVRLVLLSSLK